MKREKINSKVEEKIITSMITSNEFLGQVASTLDLDLFTADHFKTIARWCKKYFERYHKAPVEYIETMYHAWVEKGKAKEETIEAVHDILEKISDDFENENQINIPYLLDEASEYFSLRKIEQLRDNLDLAVMEKDISIAQDTVNAFRTVGLGQSRGIDLFRDSEALTAAFSESQKPLFTVGNIAAQRFFQNAFARDNLIAILGPEKRGKTFWCCEFAIRALMNRKKVAMFQVGDLSQNQFIKRAAVRFAGMPMFKNQCGKIQIPIEMRKGKDNQLRIKRKTKNVPKPINEKATIIAMEKFRKRYGLSKDGAYYMTSIHPNSSINVAGITSILEKWEFENDFIPDVIIIDYADILADEPSIGGYDKRDKINETWKALRRLSQEKHCLVIAPTQADASSYNLETLTASNFSEDKRKLSHVTGMLGLNQTNDEKQAGVMRLNWIVLREAPYSTSRCLYVGQCLELARSFCCALF